MRIGGFALVGSCLGVVLVSGFAATNSVPGSRAGTSTSAITVDSLKPRPACNAITLTSLVTGSGIFNGTASADLITGSSGADTINGSAGDDCIVGGGGNDTFSGGLGNDVCIGGPGTDQNGILGIDACEVWVDP
jgi:Ca2+-binding RTX toxin-like protein